MPKDSETFETINTGPVKFEYGTAKAYRLARKKDGTIILQGAYYWQYGNNYGYEWHEIPTVELEE